MKKSKVMRGIEGQKISYWGPLQMFMSDKSTDKIMEIIINGIDWFYKYIFSLILEFTL